MTRPVPVRLEPTMTGFAPEGDDKIAFIGPFKSTGTSAGEHDALYAIP
jgi:hypothetical protein